MPRKYLKSFKTLFVIKPSSLFMTGLLLLSIVTFETVPVTAKVPAKNSTVSPQVAFKMYNNSYDKYKKIASTRPISLSTKMYDKNGKVVNWETLTIDSKGNTSRLSSSHTYGADHIRIGKDQYFSVDNGGLEDNTYCLVGNLGKSKKLLFVHANKDVKALDELTPFRKYISEWINTEINSLTSGPVSVSISGTLTTLTWPDRGATKTGDGFLQVVINNGVLVESLTLNAKHKTELRTSYILSPETVIAPPGPYLEWETVIKDKKYKDKNCVSN